MGPLRLQLFRCGQAGGISFSPSLGQVCSVQGGIMRTSSLGIALTILVTPALAQEERNYVTQFGAGLNGGSGSGWSITFPSWALLVTVNGKSFEIFRYHTRAECEIKRVKY